MFPTWYRFQITSALSILHRLTGIALAVGSILLAWWLVAVAAGGELFAATHAFIASPIGVLLLFGWSVAFFYHLCNGIRHLAWDAGYGFEICARLSQRLRRARRDRAADRARLALRISRIGGCRWQNARFRECNRAARRNRASARPPSRQRPRRLARMAVAAPDGARAHSARSLFRRLDTAGSPSRTK